MTISVSPTQDALNLAVRAFLTEILPSDVVIVVGQVNRVPEPRDTSFIVFQEILRMRLATNIDAWADTAFTASIAGNLMTVTGIADGAIAVGAQVFGTGLASGTTTVTDQISGSLGGTGVYQVSLSQVAPSQTLAAGRASFLQKQQSRVQLDVHGPDGSNNATVISTLFRDGFAFERFAVLQPDVVPLYADDPRQMPFINEQQQYEDRWIVDLWFQINATTIGIPQQFAGVVDVALIDVDAAFPA